jgi:hypothetical protein
MKMKKEGKMKEKNNYLIWKELKNSEKVFFLFFVNLGCDGIAEEKNRYFLEKKQIIKIIQEVAEGSIFKKKITKKECYSIFWKFFCSDILDYLITNRFKKTILGEAFKFNEKADWLVDKVFPILL